MVEIPVSGDVSEVDSADANERQAEAAKMIRLRFKAIQVEVTGLPQSRKIADNVKNKLADEFATSASLLSVSSLLWDAKAPAIKGVRAVLGRVHGVWHDSANTLPTAKDGIRYIRREYIPIARERLQGLERELRLACVALAADMPNILAELKELKGDLFREDDYANFDPVRDIQIRWSFPTQTEDRELESIDKAAYEHELARLQEEGRAAVQRLEEQLAEQLVEMLDHVIERLTNEDGKRKVFRAGTITKVFDELTLFEQQLANMHIGGPHFREAMTRLRQLFSANQQDAMPQVLRSATDEYRGDVREKLKEIATLVGTKAVEPRRRRVLSARLSPAMQAILDNGKETKETKATEPIAQEVSSG